jgi:hypothetical protein
MGLLALVTQQPSRAGYEAVFSVQGSIANNAREGAVSTASIEFDPATGGRNPVPGGREGKGQPARTSITRSPPGRYLRAGDDHEGLRPEIRLAGGKVAPVILQRVACTGRGKSPPLRLPPVEEDLHPFGLGVSEGQIPPKLRLISCHDYQASLHRGMALRDWSFQRTKMARFIPAAL